MFSIFEISCFPGSLSCLGYIRYLDFWADVFEDARETIERVMQRLFHEQNQNVQSRWLTGVAAVIPANVLCV